MAPKRFQPLQRSSDIEEDKRITKMALFLVALKKKAFAMLQREALKSKQKELATVLKIRAEAKEFLKEKGLSGKGRRQSVFTPMRSLRIGFSFTLKSLNRIDLIGVNCVARV